MYHTMPDAPHPTNEPRDYLIRKGGYYYRPGFSGYTAEISAAGRYTRTEAEREAAIEPWRMQAVPLSSVPCDDAVIMRIWRECDLPEWFLGNGGTNHKLVTFARRYASGIMRIPSNSNASGISFLIEAISLPRLAPGIRSVSSRTSRPWTLSVACDQLVMRSCPIFGVTS